MRRAQGRRPARRRGTTSLAAVLGFCAGALRRLRLSRAVGRDRVPPAAWRHHRRHPAGARARGPAPGQRQCADRSSCSPSSLTASSAIWSPATSRAAVSARKACCSIFRLDVNGVFGSVFGVAATIVVTFLFFGALLDRCGGADFFTDLAIAVLRPVPRRLGQDRGRRLRCCSARSPATPSPTWWRPASSPSR